MQKIGTKEPQKEVRLSPLDKLISTMRYESVAWYSTFTGKLFSKFTDGGKWAYTWVAECTDGSVIYQLEESELIKILSGVHIPRDWKSVKVLDVNKVKKFVLLPTGISKELAPWIRPVQLIVDIGAREKFISYWTNDINFNTGIKICRHIVGIAKLVKGSSVKFLTVVSPSGAITVSSNTDVSFEGE